MAAGPVEGVRTKVMVAVEQWLDYRIARTGGRQHRFLRKTIEDACGVLHPDEWAGICKLYIDAGWINVKNDDYVGQPGNAEGPYFLLSME